MYGHLPINVAVVRRQQEAITKGRESLGNFKRLELDSRDLYGMVPGELGQNKARLGLDPANEWMVAVGDEEDIHGRKD